MYRRTTTNEQGLLCKSSVRVVPRAWQESWVRKIHEIIGHQGVRGTLEQVQSRVYFPGLGAAVEKMIKMCQVCNPAHLLGPARLLGTQEY